MQLLREETPDTVAWNALIASRPGRMWLDTEWYLAESYFYRRILEAVRYFHIWSRGGEDPFAAQKHLQTARAVASYRALPPRLAVRETTRAFEALLHSCLWGNRADLSNLSMRATPVSGLASQQERHQIIVDDTRAVHALLASGVREVDIVCDNVGLDILADLALADFLLDMGWAQCVALHLKDRPFFVSDAMQSDVAALMALMQEASSADLRSLSRRLASKVASGRIRLDDDPFWASALMFRDLPEHMERALTQAELVILKGDVNYRRLLDDRHWPFTTPIGECAGYFPTTFLALRTLKGEILAGLAPGQSDAYASEDPCWLTNGRRGVVQLGGGPTTCRRPSLSEARNRR
jgi:uncharacterized protein with ATP-grasp and redox domains